MPTFRLIYRVCSFRTEGRISRKSPAFFKTAPSKMYENNVELVRQHAKLCEQQHQTLLLNVQCMQRTQDMVEKNQFCPYVRLQKQAPGQLV